MEKQRTNRNKTPYPYEKKGVYTEPHNQDRSSTKLGKRPRSPQAPRKIPSDFEEDEKKAKQETERIPASVPAKRKKLVTFAKDVKSEKSKANVSSEGGPSRVKESRLNKKRLDENLKLNLAIC